MRLSLLAAQNQASFSTPIKPKNQKATPLGQSSKLLSRPVKVTVTFGAGGAEKRRREKELEMSGNLPEGVAEGDEDFGSFLKYHLEKGALCDQAIRMRQLSQVLGNANDFPVFSNEELAKEFIQIPGVNTESPEFSYDLLKGENPMLAGLIGKLHTRTHRLISADSFISSTPKARQPWEARMRHDPERFMEEMRRSVERRNELTSSSEVLDETLWRNYKRSRGNALKPEVVGQAKPNANQSLAEQLQWFRQHQGVLARDPLALNAMCHPKDVFDEPRWQNTLIAIEKVRERGVPRETARMEVRESENMSDAITRSAESALTYLKHANPTLGEMIGKLKNKTLRCILADKFVTGLSYKENHKEIYKRLLAVNTTENSRARQKLIDDLQGGFDQKDKSLPASESLDSQAWQKYEEAKLNAYFEQLRHE